MCRALDINLRVKGFDLIIAYDAESALHLAHHRLDMVFLDMDLPGIRGVNFLKQLREFSTAPILILSTQSSTGVRPPGLESVADQHFTTAFGMADMFARVHEAFQQLNSRPHERKVVRTADFTIDLASRQVLRHGVPINLTPLEWSLLDILLTHPNQLVTARELFVEDWGPTFSSQLHHLRTHISRLRHKLEPDPSHPKYLLTEFRLGYRFRISAEVARIRTGTTRVGNRRSPGNPRRLSTST